MEDLFKNVKYYFIGDVPRAVEHLLNAGGGKKEHYLSEMISHVVTDDGDDDEVNEAKELFQLPVVKSSWVLMSVQCCCLLPTGVFDPDPKLMLFFGVVVCPSQVSTSDNKVIWALVTIYGGRYQTVLDNNVTHLVTTEVRGAKYEAVQNHRKSVIKVVTPDWILHTTSNLSRADERCYDPRLLHSNCLLLSHLTGYSPNVSQHSAVLQLEQLSQSSAAKKDRSDSVVGSKKLTSLSQPFSAVAVVSQSSQSSSMPLTMQSLTVHQLNRSHLRNIGNGNDFVCKELKNVSKPVSNLELLSDNQVPGQLSKTHQQTSGLSSSTMACCGMENSDLTAESVDSREYYGHDPGEHVPEDVCLLGCIFYIAEYQKCLEPMILDMWIQVISHHGGQVDDSYSNRITHVLCEHQQSDVFQLALRDGKRLVTAYWLNDCLLARRMLVPYTALHLPYVFGKDQPCSNQIICMTNFVGDERERVKHMIALVGAKYTGYMSRANSVLVAKHSGGAKCEKAVEWGIPVVGMHWLNDVVLGDLGALKLPLHPRYMSFFGGDVFQIDCRGAAHLLEGWKSPVKISKEMWKKFNSSQPLRSTSTCSDGASSNRLPLIGSNESADRFTSHLSQAKVPIVLLTGFARDKATELSEAVLRIGGQLVQSVAHGCTHLVANSILRTVKFLTALGVVQHIVTSDWIEQSSLANRFLDENRFELVDEKMELTFNFKLRDSLQRATEKKLFQHMAFFFTPGVEPNKTVLGSIVHSCDGCVVESLPRMKDIKKFVNNKGEPTFVIITCADDLYLCQDIISHDIAVHNAEFILTGVMRQQIDYNTYRIG